MKNNLNKLIIDSKPGRTVSVNGSEFMFFSGYNYLGINQDEEFLSLILEGVNKYGWLFPSSRISNTGLDIYEECEAFLSQLTGSEDTVLLPSGFSAGRLITSLYSEIYNAPGAHPAILKNPSAFQVFDQWSNWILKEINSSNEPLVLASDSINVLSAELYNFSFLEKVNNSTHVILDDSHGIGLIGVNGRGISSSVSLSGKAQYAFCYSLSKSFGISGGAVSCSKQEADVLRSFSEYTATTPVSPAQIYAFLHGHHIYARQREALFKNIDYFTVLIKEIPGITCTEGFPVFVLPPSLDENVFYENKILISSFAYPDPAGDKLKRVVVNALHTREDLAKLASVLLKSYNDNKDSFENSELKLKNAYANK